MTATNQRKTDYEEQTKKIARRMERINHVVMVLSGKGGVGKSTVAANLAFGLAERGQRVGLLDADLHGPTIPLLTGLAGQMSTGTAEAIRPVELPGGLAVMSVAFLMLDQTQPTIWRGPMRGGVLRQFLGDVEWSARDMLIVDLPPGTGDEPLTLMQSLPAADGAIIVTTPQEASLSDCRRAINFVCAVKQRVLGVVENMSGFVCPHCGQRTDIFTTGGGERMAEEMSVPFLGRVPLASEIVALSDAGEPLIGPAAPEAIREAYAQIIDRLLAEIGRSVV